MRGLKEIIHANKVWSERRARNWQDGKTIFSPEDIKNLHPFPMQSDRRVIFAFEISQKSCEVSDFIMSSDCTEKDLPNLFSWLLGTLGKFSIVYAGSTANQIRLVLWN